VIDPAETSAVKTRTWKDLGVRLISAIILIVVCYIPFYFGGGLWLGLIAIFGACMMYEWVRMSDKEAHILNFIVPMAGMLIAIGLCYIGDYHIALLVAVATALLAILTKGLRGGLLWAGLGTLYIIIPLISILWLRGFEFGWSGEGFRKLAFIIVAVIAADVGAYFGGSYFKGKKMAPKLSPNKSWSGFFSGMLAGAIAGVIIAWVMDFSLLYGALLALPLTVFSVMGDFLESGLKRKLNVKDTGGVLPGHGGVLDRVDSLMFTVVVCALAIVVMPGLWPH